jgi:acyl-coenzyme A thioesterase PaaI-like protein
MNDRDTPSLAENRALVSELRDIAETLAVADVAPDCVAEARRLASALRAQLSGPPRPRWYHAEEANPGTSPDSRNAYLAQSPIRGHLNPIAPPLVLAPSTRSDGSACLRGELEMGRRYEGPPHGVHGGWVAALFDEALGSVQGLTGKTGMTALLKVRYRHVTPVNQPLTIEAWVHEERGRRTIARATCHAGGLLTADAEGTFIVVDFDSVEAVMAERAGSDPPGP